MSDMPNLPEGKETPEDDPRFRYLREAIMLSSDPKPGYHLDGMFVMSVWHNYDTDDRNADFLCSPPESLRDMIDSIKAFAEETGL